MLAKVPAAAQRRDPRRLLGDLRHRGPHRRRHRARAGAASPPCRPASTPSPSTYGKLYPAAVKCLLTDREQLTSYLRFPAEHHKRIRHSNFIERTFGETRRRVKVIGRLPGETSCLNLVWAVLDRASRGWRGVNTTSTGTPPAARPTPPAPRPANPDPPNQPPRPASPKKLSQPSPNISIEGTEPHVIYTAPGTPPRRATVPLVPLSLRGTSWASPRSVETSPLLPQSLPILLPAGICWACHHRSAITPMHHLTIMANAAGPSEVSGTSARTLSKVATSAAAIRRSRSRSQDPYTTSADANGCRCFWSGVRSKTRLLTDLRGHNSQDQNALPGGDSFVSIASVTLCPGQLAPDMRSLRQVNA